MTSVDEAILLFRDHCQDRLAMKEMKINDETYYVFGNTAFAGSSETSLQSMNAEKQFYTFDAIVCCWNMRDSEHNQYVREVSGKGVQVVTLIQRRRLTQYLSGDADSLLGLVQNDNVPQGIKLSDLLENTDNEEPTAKKPRLEESESIPKPPTPPVVEETPMEVDSQPQEEGIRALTQELDAEKIAQLRNRVKRKMKQTKVLAQEEQLDTFDILPFEDGSEEDVGKSLQQIEVPGCSRMGLYSCEGLDLEAVMEYITEALGKKTRQPPVQNQNRPNGPTNGNAIQKRPNAGYSRYDQEQYRPEMDTDFHIDTDLSFHGSTLKNMNNRPLPGQLLPPSQPTRPGFGPPSALHPHGKPPKRTSKTPIIVIPASGTALITMYNAEDILADLRYVSTEEKKKDKKCESDMLIHRKKENGSSVPFRIITNPLHLKDEDWDRVVAVFVQGPAWQFKGWRFGSQPTEIFARICAFHIKFDEQPLDKNVAQWSVNVLSLSKTKRHLDRAVLKNFWSTLDKYMTKNKPHLRF